VLLILILAARNSYAQLPASPSPSPPLTNSTQSLDAWLISPNLWKTTTVSFPEARGLGFRWVSNSHDAARASSRALRFGDLPVAEVIARFSPENTQTSVGASGGGNL